MCTSAESCLGSMITISNIDYILCGGMNACKDADMLIINPKNGFSLHCQSTGSCENFKIDILITDPSIEYFTSITCGGSSSCQSAVVKIRKQLPIRERKRYGNKLTIMELTCGGMSSCKDSQFELSSNVDVSSCRCAGGATQACSGLVGVTSC